MRITGSPCSDSCAAVVTPAEWRYAPLTSSSSTGATCATRRLRIASAHWRASSGKPRPGIVFIATFEEPGDVVFKHACALGCEGIVSKRRGSRYRSGHSRDWIKTKNPAAPAVRREAEEDWGARERAVTRTHFIFRVKRRSHAICRPSEA
jgi:hypothetical protein